MADALLSPHAPLKTQNMRNEELSKGYVGLRQNHSDMAINEWETSDSEVAVYLRVSTDDQSIDSQFLAIEGLLRQYNLDVNDVRVFKDEGVSATKNTNLQDRPAGSALIDLIQSGKVKKVFSFQIGRMFRDNEAGAVFLKQMNSKYPDVQVITFDCPVPFNTPMGEFLFTLMVANARLEVANLGMRSMAGCDVARENLRPTSHAVFGWTIINPKTPVATMEPNWKQQDVMDWAINQNKKDSYAKIARQLNEWGILTATKRSFSAGTIRRMVLTPPKQQDMLHVFDRPERRSKPPFRTLSITQK